MDIGLSLNSNVDVRIILIIETRKGYIFQKGNLGYYWIVDNKIQFSESSEDAAKRMLEETFGIIIDKIKLNAIVESFYFLCNEYYREFCFVYKYRINRKIDLPNNYYIFSKEEMEKKK
jgi:hypothetical protein